MRTIAAPALALLPGHMALVQLTEMRFSSGTIYIANCRDDIVYGGNTYLGGKQMAIDPIKDQGGQVQGLNFSLNGVPSDLLALALVEPIQGRPIIVSLAIMDPDSQVILAVDQVWSGTMDVMPITQDGISATVSVTAEHRGISFARPKGVKYTDLDQRMLYPLDASLQYIVSQSTHKDVWPAAGFFRK